MIFEKNNRVVDIHSFPFIGISKTAAEFNTDKKNLDYSFVQERIIEICNAMSKSYIFYPFSFFNLYLALLKTEEFINRVLF